MTNHERFMTACGPAAVALLLVGNSMAAGDTPGIGASDREITTYLANLDPAWAGAMLEMFGLVGLLVFAVALSLRAGEGSLRSLVLAGGVGGVAVKLATALPLMAVWLRPGSADPALARAALDVGSIGFAAAGALLALMPAAFVAGGVLPRWLEIAGGVTALALLAQLPLFREEFGLGFMLLMVWTVITGVVLLHKRNPGTSAALQPA